MPLNSVYFTMCTKIICNNNVCTEHTLKITVHLQHYIEQKLFSLNYPKFTHQLKLLRVEFFVLIIQTCICFSFVLLNVRVDSFRY